MWSRDDFTQTGGRFLLLLGQLLVLALCVGYIQYIYTTNLLPDKNAKDNFQQSDCFIVSKKLSTKGRFIHQYRSDFLISYNVNGVQYSRWVSGNGLDISFSRNQTEQESNLTQFDIGGNYPCWYDPSNPQLAILILRHNWLSTFPLVLPSVIIVIVIYYFLQNLFQLLGYVKGKAREVIKEKQEKRQKR